MRAIWIDENNDPDWVKMAAFGFGMIFHSLNEPVDILRPKLLKARSKAIPGVYTAWNWHPSLNGTQYAEYVHQRVTKLGDIPNLRVQFDIEAHDPQYILDCLERWRELRPTMGTSWTLESMQGGWMTPEFVRRVLDAKVRVVPQYYTGDMRPFAQDVAMKDLIRRGFPISSISGFYDAAALPLEWDGFAFTQGRLP